MKRTAFVLSLLVGSITSIFAQQTAPDVRVILVADTAKYGISPAKLVQTHSSYEKLIWQVPEDKQDKVRATFAAFRNAQQETVINALTSLKTGFFYQIRAFYRADGTAEWVLLDVQPEAFSLVSADGDITEPSAKKTLTDHKADIDRVIGMLAAAYARPLGISFAKPFSTDIAGMSMMAVPRMSKRTVRTGDSTISTLEAARLTTRPDTVKYVFFNQLDLKTVPDELYRFPNLEELDLSKNKLTELPLRLTADLPRLKRLSLLENEVGDAGIFFAKNTHLEALNLQYNKLTRVPGSVSKNRRLGSLWLGHNSMNTLAIRPLKKLKHLYDLNLYEVGLTSLPNKIWKLRHLTILDLYHNELTALPRQVGRMKTLEQLAVANNQLTELPKELAKLPRLSILFAHHNKLHQLPADMARLTNLRLLDIGTNQFSELPPVILSMPELEDLDLSKNNIQTLPPALAQLTKLKKLYMRSNPITKDDAKVGPYAKVIDQLEANKTEVFY